MNPQKLPKIPTEETKVRALYKELLENWNIRNAGKFAELFVKEGNVVGFDGSQLNGRAEIEAELSQIFAHHKTATFIAIIREVRFLCPEVALLRAVAGMIPDGKRDIDPQVNAIQTMVAVKDLGEWNITLFQNTPAQFHGRPELVEKMNRELRELL